MSSREKIKGKVENILKKVFTKFNKKGIISIYLWGSILTDEFEEGKSDIDSLAIVKENADILDVKLINEYIKERVPELGDFRINYLYLSELNNGKIRSRVAKVIPPPLLVSSFNNWEYVYGKKLSRKMFLVRDSTSKEASKIIISVLNKEYLPLIDSGDYSKVKSAIKQVLHLCYYLQPKSLKRGTFRYSNLLEDSNELTRPILEPILDIRKTGWKEKDMINLLPKIKDFLKTIK